MTRIYGITVALLLQAVSGDLTVNPVEIKRTECGGTFKADTNTLSFPGDAGESLTPGQTCVWTIHLETTRQFKFNFTQFDVNSGDSNCTDGGVRIYSLSNLVAAENIEKEIFCSTRPPRGSEFYLGGNVAVLTVSVGSSNSRPGMGFTLTWEGTAFDPMRTKHISTFTSAESGVISYPVVGTYEPNVAASWVVDTDDSDKLDLEIQRVVLESCPNPDPCTCDALIFYQVSELNGELWETERFCSNSTTSINIFNINRKFVLAFFSDFNSSPNVGLGFSTLYYPATEITDPTTTAEPTTTSFPEVSECGKVLTEPSGVISYKLNTNYDANERCVWIIQVDLAISYNIRITHYGVPANASASGEGLLLTGFDSAAYLDTFFVSDYNTQIQLDSKVVVVTFATAVTEGNGFRLEYEASRDFSSGLPPLRSFIVDSVGTRIEYPDNGLSYPNNVLATFVFSPNMKFDSSNKLVEYSRKSLEVNCNCCDHLSVFAFRRSGDETIGWVPSTLAPIICNDKASALYSHDDMYLIIFASDDSGSGLGFSWTFSEIPALYKL